MKKLRHPHVTRLSDVLKARDGATYLVMEFVPRGPLLSGVRSILPSTSVVPAEPRN